MAGIEPPVKVTFESPGLAVTDVPPAGGAWRWGQYGDHHAAGQVVGERRGQVGDRAVRVAQGNGKGRDPARIDGGRAERLAERGRDARGGLTVKVATAGAALLPLLVCNAPAASELK